MSEMRKDFEAWMSNLTGGQYSADEHKPWVVKIAWGAWQAAAKMYSVASTADPAWERHTSELLDSQAYQLEQLAKAVMEGDVKKADRLAREALS